MRRSLSPALAVPAALCIALLAGCSAVGPGTTATSGPPAASADSLEPGSITCDNVGAELQGIGDDLQAAADSLATDPGAAIDQFSAVASRLGGLIDATSDPQLRDKLQAVQDAVNSAVDTFSSAVQEGTILGQLQELLGKVEAVSTSVTAVSDYCRGA